MSTSIPEAPTSAPSQADLVAALDENVTLAEPGPSFHDRVRALAAGTRTTVAALRSAVIDELRPGITAARARSGHTGTQAASTISDFTRASQDVVAAFVKAGSNITIARDTTNGTLTVNATATGGSTVDADGETIRDTIAAALRAGAGIQVLVDDPGNTIEVRVSGLTASQISNATASGLAVLTGSPADGRSALGLGAVNNTADADKPLSAAAAAALAVRMQVVSYGTTANAARPAGVPNGAVYWIGTGSTQPANALSADLVFNP